MSRTPAVRLPGLAPVLLLASVATLAGLVILPLGLEGMFSVIRSADRHLYARSYWPAMGDRPPLTGGPLDRAPWSRWTSPPARSPPPRP